MGLIVSEQEYKSERLHFLPDIMYTGFCNPRSREDEKWKTADHVP